MLFNGANGHKSMLAWCIYVLHAIIKCYNLIADHIEICRVSLWGETR